MFTPFHPTSRGARSALRLIACIAFALLLLPGMSGLPARASTSVDTPARAVAALTLPNGTLVRDTSSGRVSLVWQQRRHWIDSPATLEALGWASQTIIAITTDQNSSIPNGTVLSLHTVADGQIWPWSRIKSDPVQLDLAQPSATAGGTLKMDAYGFQPGELVTIVAPGSITFTAFADGRGAFTVNVPVQSGMAIGLHHIYAQGSQSGLFGVQVFYVIAPAPAPASFLSLSGCRAATRPEAARPSCRSWG